jgi:ACR3 family arsenite efflux pump ArsB
MRNSVKILVDFVGRHASSVLPSGILLGLLIPPLASSMRPFLIPALFIPLTLSLVRIETRHLRRSLKRWRWVTLLSFWILVIRPVTVWFVLEIFSSSGNVLCSYCDLFRCRRCHCGGVNSCNYAPGSAFTATDGFLSGGFAYRG